MKTTKIVNKLEKIFGKSNAQKSKDRQVEAVNELIGRLEAKELKFKNKLEAPSSESNIPDYEQKLSIAQIHIAKAREFIKSLES